MNDRAASAAPPSSLGRVLTPGRRILGVSFLTDRSSQDFIVDLAKLDQSYVVVVQHFSQPKGVIHQVTLRPDKIRDGLIRLGDTQGDELNGWNYPQSFKVISVLGTSHEKDGKWECRPIENTGT